MDQLSEKTDTENLPLLPLTSGVVLPGMVFTMALESDEAKAAAEAAEAADGHFVIVPFIDGRYASVGVVAEVMEKGELPGGMPAVAVRGVERARLGTAVPGTGQALWVEVEILPEEEASDEATELAREYRAVVENILVSRGAGRLAERLGEVCPWPRRSRSWRPWTWWPGCGWSSHGRARSWPT
jgi:ATP-dependent Lon protease